MFVLFVCAQRKRTKQTLFAVCHATNQSSGMAHPLAEQIGITFRDERLLQCAIIHRSFINEHPERVVGLESNERLEFLGDSILNFLTADWLYRRYTDHSEGGLTQLRSNLVNTAALAGFARRIELGKWIRIGKGIDTSAERDRPALLADAFEALVGAIYLDQGIEVLRSFLTPFLEQQIAAIQAGAVAVNYRTRLQEIAQARFGYTPRYQVDAVHGPDHQREYTLQVIIGDQVWGVGSGSSKQAAAQAAAQVALERLVAETE
jgi:ribonuclease-3